MYVLARAIWHEYLIKEFAGGSQKSLGVRSDATELIFKKFKERKAQISERLTKLISASHEQLRLNKAMRVGRVPSIVVKTLNALQKRVYKTTSSLLALTRCTPMKVRVVFILCQTCWLLRILIFCLIAVSESHLQRRYSVVQDETA